MSIDKRDFWCLREKLLFFFGKVSVCWRKKYQMLLTVSRF